MRRKIVAAVMSAVMISSNVLPICAETISGTGWWQPENQVSQDYVLSGDDSIVAVIQTDVNDFYSTFCVEVTDGTSWFTTTSLGDLWWAGEVTSSTDTYIEVNPEMGTRAAIPGNTYFVKVTRTGNRISICYEDHTNGSVLWTDLTGVSGVDLREDLNVRVLAQEGILEVDWLEEDELDSWVDTGIGNNTENIPIEDLVDYKVLYDGTLEITECTYTSAIDVVIPEYIDGKKVTGIGEDAFLGCSNLRTVTLPAGITYIGDRAFYECYNLQNINIPEGVTYIGDRAFMNCELLTGLVFPSTLKRIGNNTFVNCNSIYSAVLPDGMESIGSHAFDACNGLYSINIPKGVKTIEYAAFQNCESLTYVTLSEDVKVIENYAFVNCRNLLSVNIPDGIEAVGENAFQWCSNLGDLDIPKSVIDNNGVNYDCKVVNIRENAVLEWLGWNASHTKGCEVDEEGIEITFRSQTYDKAINNWDTPVVFVYKGDEARVEGVGYAPYVVLRSDFYAWGPANENGEMDPIFHPENWFASGYSLEGINIPMSVEEWNAWLEANKQGVDCCVRARIEGKTAIVELETNGIINIATFPVDPSESVYLSISGELCRITDMREVKSKNTIDDIQVTKSQYSFDFYDKTTLQKAEGVSVTYNGRPVVVDHSIATITAVDGQPWLYAEYGGQTYAYYLEDYQQGIVNTVLVSSEAGAKLAYVRAKCYAKWYDVLYEKLTINKADDSLDTMSLSYGLAGFAGEAIQQIRLVQNGSIVASTTDTHKMEVEISKLSKGNNIYLEVVTAQRSYTYPLTINVAGTEDNSSATLEGDSLKFKVSEDIPILGGMEMEFEMPELPVYIHDAGDTVRLGINVKNNVLFDDGKVNELKASMENILKDIQSGKTTGKTKDMNNLKQCLQSGNTGHKKGEFEFSILGYGEYTKTEASEVEVAVNLVVTCKVSFSADKTFLVPVAIITVPVVVSVEAEGELSACAEVRYNLTNQVLTGNISINGKIAVELFAGVGVSDVIGAGIYGKAALELIYNILSTCGNEGLQSIMLSGEVGLKAYAMSWKATLPLMSGTYNIYSKTETYDVYEQVAGKLYESASYALDSNDYNSVMAENIENGLMAEDVYSATAPQMVALENGMLMVYRVMAENRTDENKVMLMYRVYDKVSKTWSEPQAVHDDGTMDWGFELISDGDSVWLVYQNATEVLSNITSLDDITPYLGVGLQKFDAESETFGDIIMVAREGYNYMPSACVEDDTVHISWVHNDNKDYFAENSENDVYYATYSQAAGLTAGRKIFSGTNSVTSLKTGWVNGQAQVACISDNDNDLATTENTLYILGVHGERKYSESGVITTSGYETVKNTVGLYWCNAGTLKTFGQGVSEVTTYADMALQGGYDIDNDFLYFAEDTENGEVLSVLDLSDANAQPIQLIATDGYVDSFDVVGEDIVYVESEAVVLDEDVETVSDLKYETFDKLLADDIAVEQVVVLGNEMSCEGGIPVEVTVKNNGIRSVNNIEFSVKEGESVLFSHSVSGELSSGCNATYIVVLPTDCIEADKQYGMFASSGQDESNLTDNMGVLCVDKAEVEISSTVYATEYGVYEVITIKNNSPVAATGYVVVTGEDGSEIERISIYDLGFEEVQNALIKFEKDDTGQIVTTTAVCGDEYYLFNNSVSQYVYAMTDYEHEHEYTNGYCLKCGKQYLTFAEEWNIVTGIREKTCFEEFMKWMSGIAKVYNSAHEQQEDENRALRTGDIIRLNGTEKEYEVCIKGDVCADGSINVLDMESIQKHLLQISELEGVYKEAACINKKDSISVIDMEEIQKHILQIKDINEK